MRSVDTFCIRYSPFAIRRVPCLTLRENTERPVTVTQGTNTVVGCDPGRIVTEALAILDGRNKRGRMPELWDGRAAERIVNVLDLWEIRNSPFARLTTDCLDYVAGA